MFKPLYWQGCLETINLQYINFHFAGALCIIHVYMSDIKVHKTNYIYFMKRKSNDLIIHQIDK